MQTEEEYTLKHCLYPGYDLATADTRAQSRVGVAGGGGEGGVEAADGLHVMFESHFQLSWCEIFRDLIILSRCRGQRRARDAGACTVCSFVRTKNR